MQITLSIPFAFLLALILPVTRNAMIIGVENIFLAIFNWVITPICQVLGITPTTPPWAQRVRNHSRAIAITVLVLILVFLTACAMAFAGAIAAAIWENQFWFTLLGGGLLLVAGFLMAIGGWALPANTRAGIATLLILWALAIVVVLAFPLFGFSSWAGGCLLVASIFAFIFWIAGAARAGLTLTFVAAICVGIMLLWISVLPQEVQAAAENRREELINRLERSMDPDSRDETGKIEREMRLKVAGARIASLKAKMNAITTLAEREDRAPNDQEWRDLNKIKREIADINRRLKSDNYGIEDPASAGDSSTTGSGGGAVTGSHTFSVPATTLWYNTGLNVTGKHFRIRVVGGRWKNHPNSGYNAGEGRSPYAEKNQLIVPAGDLSALVGKTNHGTFVVGNYYTGTGSGTLYLSINDKEGYYDDNSGSLTVIVEFL